MNRFLAPSGPLVRLAALGAVALACACSRPDPLVPTIWADEARAAWSDETPDGGPYAVSARYGPPGAREREHLADLHGAPDLGEVVVRLEAGLYLLEHPVLLTGARRVVIEGAGAARTRLELDTENKVSLLIAGAERVEVRDLTLVGYSGGGIRIKECPDVRVEDACFAGARVGLDLQASTASVRTSVFAGCQEGIVATGGVLKVREATFQECWVGIDGRPRLDLASTAFVENHDAIQARLDGRSRVVSNLFAGPEQDLAWEGRPGEAASNLVAERDLGDRVGEETNRPVGRVEEFPGDLRRGLPPRFDIAGVHLAVERARLRGEADPETALRDIGLDQARVYAEAAQEALRAEDVPAARSAARIALAYLGDVPLREAPPAVVDVAGLVDE